MKITFKEYIEATGTAVLLAFIATLLGGMESPPGKLPLAFVAAPIFACIFGALPIILTKRFIIGAMQELKSVNSREV